MRGARVLLLACLVVGVGAIVFAARGHLRELESSLLESEERVERARLKEEGQLQAESLRRILKSGRITATYDLEGNLLRPAPPATARPFEPPHGSFSIFYLESGDFARARQAARSSADRAAALVAQGTRTKDPESLRLALEEEALTETDLSYRVRLEIFRLGNQKPDEEWRDDVSALLGGPSEGLGRALLKEARCVALGEPAQRRSLAELDPRPGYSVDEREIRFVEQKGETLLLRALTRMVVPTGEGPLSEPMPEPFEAISMRGSVDLEAVDRSLRSRARLLIGLYGFAAALLIAGTAYALVAIRRAERLAGAKSDFVATVTHELKTPLANIRLYAESLRDGRVRDEDRGEFLETILDEGDRLNRLVESLLHAARGPALKKETLPPRDLILEAEQRWRPRLEQEGFEFEVRAPPLPDVLADREALLRALGNLIENARKYSTEERRIELSGTAERGTVRISVADRGPGIPVAQRSRVLAPFARLESADRMETRGAGLGLSLVRACMDAHGGHLEIRDAGGGGAAVTLILPVEAQR
ncbi:MAG: sensor histidine kinase [Planctomycetota bacterium]|jgi:two-component system phosphate regulon sensor histidine kinase PhoR